jgi:flagella basal body P-ring formation protein FlgA
MGRLVYLLGFFSTALGAACVAVEGDRILAGDLARAVPAFGAIAPDTPFGYAPEVGARRFYRAAELSRLAERHHVEISPGQEACVERKVQFLDPAQVLETLKASLPQGQIELLEYDRQPVPPGPMEFPISGLWQKSGTAVWKGWIRYSGGRRFPIWAKVKVSISGFRVVAKEDLPAGIPIQSSQLKIETYAGPPSAGLFSPERIIGLEPRRSISAGQVITGELLQPAKEVHSGDVVRVGITVGQARVEVVSQAQSDGRHGQLIPLRNLESGVIVKGRVDGPGVATIVPGGTAQRPMANPKRN